MMRANHTKNGCFLYGIVHEWSYFKKIKTGKNNDNIQNIFLKLVVVLEL